MVANYYKIIAGIIASQCLIVRMFGLFSDVMIRKIEE